MSDNSIPKYVLWPYTPNIIGGAIAAGTMGILFLVHVFRLFRNRTWYCIPLIIGAIFETIGYAARADAHFVVKGKDTHADTNIGKRPYIIQSTLILVAPILFAASIYMILGRLMIRTDAGDLSMIRPTRVTKIFVGGDILSFFVQVGGSGMLVGAKDKKGFHLGEHIILGGLILQIAIFGFFVIVASTWHRRLLSQPTPASSEIGWTRYLWLLYGASTCITIRNTCRVIEYALGQDGYLLSHEWPLYAYDFIPMTLVLVVCIAWYDPNIKPKRKTDIEFAERSD